MRRGVFTERFLHADFCFLLAKGISLFIKTFASFGGLPLLDGELHEKLIAIDLCLIP
jgi:hypothetical protein